MGNNEERNRRKSFFKKKMPSIGFNSIGLVISNLWMAVTKSNG